MDLLQSRLNIDSSTKHLNTIVWEIFTYKNLNFRVKNFSDLIYLSEKFLKRNFETSMLIVQLQCDCTEQRLNTNEFIIMERVWKTLLYSRLPHLSGNMDSSSMYRLRLLHALVCSSLRNLTIGLGTDFSYRKYFTALIIRCRTYFEYLIFGHHCTSENFSTPKFSWTAVDDVNMHTSLPSER